MERSQSSPGTQSLKSPLIKRRLIKYSWKCHQSLIYSNQAGAWCILPVSQWVRRATTRLIDCLKNIFLHIFLVVYQIYDSIEYTQPFLLIFDNERSQSSVLASPLGDDVVIKRRELCSLIKAWSMICMIKRIWFVNKYKIAFNFAHKGENFGL